MLRNVMVSPTNTARKFNELLIVFNAFFVTCLVGKGHVKVKINNFQKILTGLGATAAV